jgi:hypothetical protein
VLVTRRTQGRNGVYMTINPVIWSGKSVKSMLITLQLQFFLKKTLKQEPSFIVPHLLKLDTIHSTVTFSVLKLYFFTNTFLHLMFASIYMVGFTFVCMMHVIVYTRFLREFCQ